MAKRKLRWDKALHWIMSFVGGFLGIYAVALHSGNFGSAQTGNLMELTREVTVEHDLTHVLVRVLAFIIFGCGIAASYLLTNLTKIDMWRLTLVVDALGLSGAAWLMSLTTDPVVGLYPIFFCSAFQWGTYSGAAGYGSATIFISNNYKQALMAWIDFFMTKNRTFFSKAVLYSVTVLTFVLGAVTAGIAVALLGVSAAYVAFVPLAVCWVLSGYEKLPAEDGTPEERMMEATEQKHEASILESKEKTMRKI